MEKLQFRQGDVYLQQIDKIPDGLTKKNKEKIILAYGEATGHNHAIEEVDKVESFVDSTEKLYLSVADDIELTHQEHAKIKIPKENYEVIIQREYSPEEIRKVWD